jgi:MoaA/NifB/PqqE/SkfB family radical SAM enzyme
VSTSFNDLPEIPFLRNIGYLLTYKCQVQCPHCIVNAGPHRTEEMDLEEACQWIREIATYRNGYIQVLSLTGGEPFFDLNKLKRISQYGKKNGLLVSAVTNAYWATSEKEALRILKFVESIAMLSISADAHHQKHIPLERVRNAVRASRSLGVPFTIAVCTENEETDQHREMMEKLCEFVHPEEVLTAVTFRAGRALKNLKEDFYLTTTSPPSSACAAGSSPIICPDGRVLACIGPVIELVTPHPLQLGNLRKSSLQEVLDKAELNPILHAIRVWGPAKLISLIETTDLANRLPATYVKGSICNACYAIMADPHLVSYLEELATDEAFLLKVGYARAYYLRENIMAESLCLEK